MEEILQKFKITTYLSLLVYIFLMVFQKNAGFLGGFFVVVKYYLDSVAIFLQRQLHLLQGALSK